MAQTFRATLPTANTNIFQDNVDQINNDNTLRSLFSGTAFPTNPTPVIGQMCYRTDLNMLYIYTSTGWVEISQIGGLLDAITNLENTKVTGPASATDDAIAAYNGTTGKKIKNTTKKVADIVVGPASTANDTIAIFNGTTGKIIKNSGYTIAQVRDIANGSITDAKMAAKSINPSKSIDATAGNHIIYSDPTTHSTDSTSYVKACEYTIKREGAYKIKFTITSTSGPPSPGKGIAMVYRNGSPITDPYEGNYNYPNNVSVDISGWAYEDLCQIYYKYSGGGALTTKAQLSDFSLGVNNPFI